MTTVSPAPPTRQIVESRWAARRFLWRESALARVRVCGHHSVTGDGQVMVRLRDGRLSFAGLATCGSVWACAVCSARIHAERRAELEAGFGRWLAGDGRLAFVTLTMRHRKGQRLKTLWDALAYAWGKVTSGRGWVADQRRHGVEGFVRLVEVTHGPAGWHVHVHVMVFCRPGVQVEDLAGSMFGRWANALEAAGVGRPLKAVRVHGRLESVGVDAHLVTTADDAADVMAGYFTKADYAGQAVTPLKGVAYEMAPADLKAAAAGHRTPFAILADCQVLGDADDLDLWHEYERASKGRRQLTWSRGLRDRLRLGDERTDEQIAGEDLGGEDVMELDRATWAHVRDHAWRLLGYEGLDYAAARAAVWVWLADLGPPG